MLHTTRRTDGRFLLETDGKGESDLASAFRGVRQDVPDHRLHRLLDTKCLADEDSNGHPQHFAKPLPRDSRGGVLHVASLLLQRFLEGTVRVGVLTSVMHSHILQCGTQRMLIPTCHMPCSLQSLTQTLCNFVAAFTSGYRLS